MAIWNYTIYTQFYPNRQLGAFTKFLFFFEPLSFSEMSMITLIVPVLIEIVLPFFILIQVVRHFHAVKYYAKFTFFCVCATIVPTVLMPLYLLRPCNVLNLLWVQIKCFSSSKSFNFAGRRRGSSKTSRGSSASNSRFAVKMICGKNVHVSSFATTSRVWMCSVRIRAIPMASRLILSASACDYRLIFLLFVNSRDVWFVDDWAYRGLLKLIALFQNCGGSPESSLVLCECSFCLRDPSDSVVGFVVSSSLTKIHEIVENRKWMTPWRD